jgi:hypothetical protein
MIKTSLKQFDINLNTQKIFKGIEQHNMFGKLRSASGIMLPHNRD